MPRHQHRAFTQRLRKLSDAPLRTGTRALRHVDSAFRRRLGAWFLYQLVEGNFGLFSAQAHGGGVAFFAHVGGFAFGVVATLALATSGRISASDAGSRTDLAGA